MSAYLKLVDGLNTWIGRVVSWVMIFIMLLTVYDVFARWVFNAPVLWAFDVSKQLYALHFMMAAAYALLRDEHVAIDIFKLRLAERKRAMLDIVSYLIFFFPFMIALFVYGWTFAGRSWASQETSWGVVALPIYYIKTVIPIAAVLLTLQGIASVIRLVRVARSADGSGDAA